MDTMTTTMDTMICLVIATMRKTMYTMTMTDGRNDDNNKYTDVGLAKITKLLQQRVVTFSLGNHRTLLCFDNGVLNLKGNIFRTKSQCSFY